MNTVKRVPFSENQLRAIADQYGTPIFVYDEAGIRASAEALNKAFTWSPGYRNYFAVKATPTPAILHVVADEGMGFDCSSRPELTMVQREGLESFGVFYTSNNTPNSDYVLADSMGAVINVDKLPYVEQLLRALGALPSRMAIRYNPGAIKAGSDIIGDPAKAKFGDTEEHVLNALLRMKELGVESIGLHAMVASNERSPEYFGDTARLLRRLADKALTEYGVDIGFINIGGGLGINYRPDEAPADVDAVGEAVRAYLGDLGMPILTENGRYVTGPHGYLLTSVTHGILESYEPFVTVDTSVNNMARLASVAGAYHHVTVIGRENDPTRPMSIVGSMCAGTDKMIKYRELPTTTQPNDLIVIHDAGAHARANSHNYNSRLRAGEVLVRPDGKTQLIRRHETEEDLFATTRGLWTPSLSR